MGECQGKPHPCALRHQRIRTMSNRSRAYGAAARELAAAPLYQGKRIVTEGRAFGIHLLMATQLETFAECRIYRHPATSYVFCYTQLTKQERSAKLINAFLGRIYWLGEFHTSGLGVYFLKHKLVCSNRKQNFIIVYACYAMNRRRAFKCPAVSVI